MRRTIIIGLCILSWGINYSLPLYAQEINKPDSVLFYSPDTQEQEIIDLDDSLESVDGANPLEPIEDALYNVNNPGTFNNTALFMREQTELQNANDKRIVLLLVGEGNEYSWMCSGAMIGKYSVLTAAHCLHEEMKNVSITVYAGGYPSSLKAHASEILYVSAIKKGFISVKSDLGVVILDRPLGNQTGYFGATAPTLAIGDIIFSLGFPGTLLLTHPWLSKGKVILDATLPVPVIKFGSFSNTAYTEPGMSGSPVFAKQNRNQIIAVQTSLDKFSSVARGLGIIPAVIKQARQYRANEKSTKPVTQKIHKI